MSRFSSCALGAVLSLSACGPDRLPAQDVIVRVSGDPNQPLKGATVQWAGKVIATTGDEGVARFPLNGQEGEVFSINVTCPADYQSPKQPILLTFHRLAQQSKVPEYPVSCPPTVRNIVVAVRADNGPNLPINYLGMPQGRTDSSGAATFMLRVPPEEQVVLEIDTSSNERLQPVNPRKTFRVRPQDDVITIDEHFTLIPEKKRAVTYVSGPQRISSGKR